MSKPRDKETRYYIDLDLRSGRILLWDYDQREVLVQEKPTESFRHRIYISKGQYNKLVKKHFEVNYGGEH